MVKVTSFNQYFEPDIEEFTPYKIFSITIKDIDYESFGDESLSQFNEVAIDFSHEFKLNRFVLGAGSLRTFVAQ